MKKLLFVWFLLVAFFFFPQNIKADTIFDFNYDDERFLDKLECTYHNDIAGVQNATCEGLGTGYYQYNPTSQQFIAKKSVYNDGRIPLGSSYSYPVDVGPDTIYYSYTAVLSNSGMGEADALNSYYYDFKKGKIYSLNYLFLVPKDVELYLNKKDIEFKAFNKNNDVIEDAIADSVVIQGYTSANDDIFYNFNDYPGHMAITNTNEFYTAEFMIQFQAAEDIDHLDFYVGYTGNLTSDEVPNFDLFLARNSYDFGSYLGISDFSVTEISEFFAVPHGGGGINLDDPSKDDESIFSNLKTCDTLDIGCYVDNILTMIKNVFVRIGNFFLSILDAIVSIGKFFADFFTVLGQVFIEIVTDIIIPDSDYLSTRFNAFSKFLSDKLGLISFPFEFTAHFLNRFLDIPNTPVKTITVPTISIGSFGTLIPGFTFNIAEYWEKPPFNQIYNIYLIFVHCFIVFCLYRLCVKKFNEIVGGCSM